MNDIWNENATDEIFILNINEINKFLSIIYTN